jgi:ubiquinone/menaquinone biosynthesis C-methylase UbiE
MPVISEEEWWDGFHGQANYSTFCDWYVPNEAVLELIRSVSNTATTTNTTTEAQEEEAKGGVSVLHIGCGTSELSVLLAAEASVSQVVNVDFSEIVINGMTQKCGSDLKTLNYSFLRADICEGVGDYTDNSFQVILDKGTLDCVALVGSEGEFTRGKQMMTTVSRLLNDNGGICILISVHGPDTRLPLLDVPEYRWTVDYIALPFSPPESPEEPVTHCYVLKKQPQQPPQQPQ